MALKLIAFTCFLAIVRAGPLSDSLPVESLLEPRIVGGREARKGEFPHLVSLQVYFPQTRDYIHFCSGSILNPLWILTTASCITMIPSRYLVVVKAGKHILLSDEPSEQITKVTDYFVHHEYSGNFSKSDIGLLKLEKFLKLNNYVAGIKLSSLNGAPKGTLTISGWGSTSSSSEIVFPRALHKANVTNIELSTCMELFKKITGLPLVLNKHICTGPLTGGVAPCIGDSGTSLVSKDKNDASEIVGIFSLGFIPCGLPGVPSIYTKISPYVVWINDIIAKNS